jgi:hypothetical protein
MLSEEAEDLIEECKKARGEGKKIVVVAGAGGWASNYAKSLKSYWENGDIVAFFFYNSKFGIDKSEPKNYHKYLLRTMKNVVKFEEWGATCFDVSDKKHDELEQLRCNLSPDILFVVTAAETHCEEAIKWLPFAKRIYVEKPFDAELKNVENLQNEIVRLGDKKVVAIRGFDHYVMRINVFVTEILNRSQSASSYLDKIGGRITRVEFRILESKLKEFTERLPSIKEGMIFDMGSHCLGIMTALTDLGSINSEFIRPAILREVEDKYDKETFAQVEFSFTSRLDGKTVKAIATFGKGVGNCNEKFVDLVGSKSKKIRCNLEYMCADLFNESGEIEEPLTPLYGEPINILVQYALEGKDLPSTFEIDKGKQIVKILTEWSNPITILGPKKLPKYKIGWNLDKILDKTTAIPIKTSF